MPIPGLNRYPAGPAFLPTSTPEPQPTEIVVAPQPTQAPTQINPGAIRDTTVPVDNPGKRDPGCWFTAKGPLVLVIIGGIVLAGVIDGLASGADAAVRQRDNGNCPQMMTGTYCWF